jgi:hypothetical protein
MQQQANRTREKQGVEVGELVLLKRTEVKKGESRKFQMPWRGLFKVVCVDLPHVTIVDCTGKESEQKRVHINQLKKFVGEAGPLCVNKESEVAVKEAIITDGALDRANTAMGRTVGQYTLRSHKNKQYGW